jgi:hypothetical protein
MLDSAHLQTEEEEHSASNEKNAAGPVYGGETVPYRGLGIVNFERQEDNEEADCCTGYFG